MSCLTLPPTDIQNNNPPSYWADDIPSDEIYDELPAYTRPARRRRPRPHSDRLSPDQQRTEHVFELLVNKTKPWATLKLHSNAKGPQQIPTYFEDERILGTLSLDLEREEPIHAITITVTGRITTAAVASETQKFLNYSHTLWSKTDGSFAPSSQSGHGTKLSGHHSWPFSFELPRQVKLAGLDGSVQMYSLPQTFVDAFVGVTILYEFQVAITRGKLRASSFIKTQMAYIPSTRPPAPSSLRQLAYREHSPLLPPDTDPEGWFVFPTVKMNSRMDVDLAIAKPCSYTRGTVIPLFLTLAPKSDYHPTLNPPAVRLLRNVAYHRVNHHIESTDAIANATWWPAYDHGGGTGGYDAQGYRKMYGEIVLKKDLKPNTSIGHFSLGYSIALFQSASPLTSTTLNLTLPHSSRPVLTHPVEIATLRGPGPAVRANAPPSYDDDFQADIRSLNMRLGLPIPL